MEHNSFSTARTIAIIGAGYSGAITAVNILRQNHTSNLRVILLDRSAKLGRGLAYRTWDDNLLLNVPAGNMSALANTPGHFLQYCQNIDPAFNSGSFVSRRIFGDYLEFTLQQEKQASTGASLELMSAEILSVRRSTNEADWRIDLAGGTSIRADQVVLAFGHFPPMDPRPKSDFYQSNFYLNNPWDFSAFDRLDDNASVALLGAAHTAVDVLFRLTNICDTRKIYLISRRGLSLQSHRSHPQPPTSSGFPRFLEGLPPTVRAYFRALRQTALKTMAEGGDWRDIMNSLRPYTSEIWQRFSIAERRRFLTQVTAYWDIHRHRLAPAAHVRLNQMLKSGQVEAIGGYIQRYAIEGNNVSIRIRERRSGRIRDVEVNKVVNCTGPNYDITTINTPLIAQLRDEGYLLQDPLKLGFETDANYQVIDRNGQSTKDLFYIGPMLKARYWESIAVPELRVHAGRLAETLIRSSSSTQ